MIDVKKLIRAFHYASEPWLTAMVETMPGFGITGVVVEAAFLGQIHHECSGFTKFEESLYYKDPLRIALIFRRAFDLDHDKVVDPEEIEFAKNYVQQPEKLANRAYANKLGNGDEASGDGWKYRGRGPIQTTFKSNYEKASLWTGVNLVLTPQEMLIPKTGCAAACGFFRDAGCIPLAQAGNLTEVTRRINAGMAGLEERLKLTQQYTEILNAP